MNLFGDSSDNDLVVVQGIHDAIIDASGGSKGFHDEGLLKSALSRPFQTAFGKDMYPIPFDKAAAVLESIARNHGFRDGNKRTAMAVSVLFLILQDILVDFSNQEYEEFMLHVVNDKPNLKEISSWLEEHAGQTSGLATLLELE